MFWARIAMVTQLKYGKISPKFLRLGFCSFNQNSIRKAPRPYRSSRNTTMAKNRNKKKNAAADMAVDVASGDPSVKDESQAMDTSETVAPGVSLGGSIRKMKMGRPMKRSKNLRKMKALAKAISLNEKSVEKVSKSESKISRTKFAKNLYD